MKHDARKAAAREGKPGARQDAKKAFGREEKPDMKHDARKPSADEGDKNPITIFGFAVGRDTLLIFGGSLALFLCLFIYFYMATPRPNIIFTYSEEPLKKIAPLSLEDGDAFVYSYVMNSSEIGKASYVVYATQKCTAIYGTSPFSPSSSACLDKGGNDLRDREGKNISLANGSMELFSPWMLAVEKGWSWRTFLRGELEGFGAVSEGTITLREAGEETLFGRDSYKIDIEMRNGNSTLLLRAWVDKEKRVLLKEEGELGSVSLAAGPFPLVIGNETIPALEKVKLNESSFNLPAMGGY